MIGIGLNLSKIERGECMSSKLFMAGLIAFGVSYNSAQAAYYKCTAYCGEPVERTVETREARRCPNDLWSKNCGGERITQPDYDSLARYRIISMYYDVQTAEQAYGQLESSCKDSMGSMNAFLFRRFSTNGKAILPDIDDALKTCALYK